MGESGARIGFLGAVFLAALILPRLAQAQPVAGQDGKARRYEGFYLNLAGGPALVRTKATRLGRTLTMRGLGLAIDVAAGWFVSENLAVLGQVTNAGAFDPVAKEGGNTENTDGLSVGMWGLGAGVVYYLMPAHVHFSGTLGLASINLGDREDTGRYPEGSTDTGLGAAFAVGKQWWVSDGWALGLAARMSLLRLKNPVTPGTPPAIWTGGSFTLAFAASFG